MAEPFPVVIFVLCPFLFFLDIPSRFFNDLQRSRLRYAQVSKNIEKRVYWDYVKIFI